jgi:hypothetical protein
MTVGMYTVYISVFLFIAPLNVYGNIGCWCQKGPATYQELVDSEYSSSYTNCYLSGNTPSSDTCYDATCPGGDWVLGNTYAFGEQSVSAVDGDDCISQCAALGGDFNIANMFSTCGGGVDDDDNNNLDDDNTSYSGSCNILTCPGIFDGHCGAFQKETDKWCNYDAPGSSANICCAEDANECCESDGAAVGGTIAGVVVFLGFCFWYCRRRRDNTNDQEPNYCFKMFCPPCAVMSYQGCEDKTDACMSCCLCSFFTLCCWEPKQVVVVENTDNTDNIECVDVSRDNNQQIINNF